jgi:hypothetical protein
LSNKNKTGKKVNNLKSRRQKNLTTTLELLNQNNSSKSSPSHHYKTPTATRTHHHHQHPDNGDYFDDFLKSLEDINGYLEERLVDSDIHKSVFYELKSQAHSRKSNKRYFTQPIILREESRIDESIQPK